MVLQRTVRMLCAIAAIITIAIITHLYTTHRKGIYNTSAQSIYSVLEKYRITYDIDDCAINPKADKTPQPLVGKDQCIEHITNLITGDKPLKLVIVAFPFKSANHERKTLSSLPDMAERKSLEYLQHIMQEIKAVYKPGAQLTIVCDGIPFAKLFSIPLAEVVAYENALKLLATDLPYVKLYTSADLMRNNRLTNLSDIPAFIDNQAATHTSPPPSQLEIAGKRIALEFDHTKGREFLLTHPLADVTTQLVQRERKLQALISSAFPASRYLRLTVHFSADVSKKFGIKLSPDSCITPYHGVLVEESDGSWSIRFKKDVDLKKYTLDQKTINGITCNYFKQKGNTP